jgi:hypothetical protein
VIGLVAAMALVLAGAVLAARVAGPSRLERAAVLVLIAAILPVPFFVETSLPFARFWVGLMVVAATLRAVDLVRGVYRSPLRHRVFHMLVVFDARLAAPRPRGLDRPALGRGLLWLVVAGAALAAVLALGPAPLLWPARVARWGAALVSMVATMEVANAWIPVVWGLAGVRPPVLHDAPYLARSVTEFWGLRWNRIVGTWLRLNVLKPLVRRRHPRAGVAAAFAVSGLIHGYLALTELPWPWAALMAGFFLAQLPLVLIERALALPRRHPALARAWTVAGLALTSPLFTAPMLRIIDGGGGG